MDQNPMFSDHPDPAASPEPSSTRPNPFDDSDTASRKRRRTSPSDSPNRSVDTTNQTIDSSSPATLDTNMTDSLTKDNSGPLMPHTPEQQSSSRDSPAEAPSSMVTINLRNDPPKDAMSPPPTSPSPIQHTPASGTATSNVKSSVEEVEVDLVSIPGQSVDKPQRSSLSASGSPAIEIITITEDEEMESDEPSAGVSILREERNPINPLPDFPYREPEESVLETLHRLIQYISTQSPLDENILRSVQQWLNIYLRYVKVAGLQAELEACRQHRPFWVLFPDIIYAMTNRKTALLKNPALHDVSMELFVGYAKLAAWFVTLDYGVIQDLQSRPIQQHERGPDLFSPIYLQQLHALVWRNYFDHVHGGELPMLGVEDATIVIKALQISQGGRLNNLAQLATALMDLVPAMPRMANNLVWICQIFADIMAEFAYALHFGQQGRPIAKQRLELGHQLHNQVSDLLIQMVEKHVTHLSSEGVLGQINALTGMLKYSLHGDHQLAVELVTTHRRLFPDLMHNYTREAIVSEKRFDILIKLIRSSQMQLRVMAVTTMCSDLVSRWKDHGDAGQEGSLDYLRHLADYLLGTGLIEYILGSNCHPEIIVESANIVGFLVVSHKYHAEHTDLLWQGITSSQDPRIAEALTRMITSIINLFDYVGLLGLCRKFQTLPLEGFTLPLRNLCTNVLRQMVAQVGPNRIKTLGIEPFDLCLRLLRESSICVQGSQVAHPEMQQLAMQKLSDLLDWGPDIEGRNQLYLSCIGDIAEKSPTSLGSLWCLFLTIRPAMVAEMRVLTEQHDLTRLIIDELEHAIETARASGFTAILCGATHHPRREFITNIIQLEPYTINDEAGRKLWDILVGVRSPCFEDRKEGWNVLNSAVKKSSFQNPFLRKCFSEYLPTLTPTCFCENMLDFVKEEILPRVTGLGDLVLDDPDMISTSGIEQLWRIILSADDDNLASQAIHTLVVNIYLESQHIQKSPFHRSRKIHLSLVNRSLQQLKEAARKITASNEGTTSGDDEPMVIVATEEQAQEQERLFIRSLRLLRFFLEAHRMNPRFAAPDVRTLISQAPYEIEGDSAELKYQSFDGHQQTEVRPLSIGKLNTAASLLASIKQETGFDNYRVFYRGQPFHPNEHDICKSLEDLRVHDGLILVKREEDGQAPPARIKPGANSLETEVSAHFDEIWEYLNMEEKLAQEIYHFLVRLPTNGHILHAIDAHEVSYKDIFPPGQPFKSLYAVHALMEYTEAISQGRPLSGSGPRTTTTHAHALKKSISLVVRAISDEAVLERTSESLRLNLSSSMMQNYLRFLDGIDKSKEPPMAEELEHPAADRLVDIITAATACRSETAFHLISSTLAAILQLSLRGGDFWEDLKRNALFPSLLRDLLLLDVRKGVRAIAAKQIEDAVAAEEKASSVDPFASSQPQPGAMYPLAQYFWTTISELVPQSTMAPTQCDELFRVACSLLATITERSPGLVDTHRLALAVGQLLLNHTSTEHVGHLGAEDTIAKGLASILLICVRLDHSLAKSLPSDIGSSLLWNLLYPKKRSHTEQPVPKVLLSTDTRTKLGEVILTLAKTDRQRLRRLLKDVDTLLPFYAQDEEDPYLYELPYQFDRSRALRSPCGYAGLQNLSNTCYLNSLLTQLFMNTGFRQFILAARVRETDSSRKLLLHTQKLFGFMQDSYRRFIDPTSVVASIKTYDESSIDIHNQMDVDEFYNLLFDRWEGQMATGIERKKLRSFYGGQLVQQVKSKECEHISERLEPFSAIQCDIKGKSTLEDSLQAYVDGEIMEGDNKYKCSTCDRHVDAVKRACLKDIPDNVIFHLKRFDFNLRTLQRNKINDYFSFPTRVDMRPYTIDHLSSSVTNEEEDVFELVGVLVHSGTAESGHYYSYIRERPSSPDRQTWVEFNDDLVTPWDPALLENSTFGGPDQRSAYETNGVVYDKSYSAYMLFYQRASSLRADQEKVEGLQLTPLQVDMSEELKEHILNENTLILRRHCLFDPSHMQFLQELFEETIAHCDGGLVDPDVGMTSNMGDDAGTGSNNHDLRDLAIWTMVNYLDQIVSRAKDTPYLASFSKLISNAVLACRHCALAFYDYFNKRHAAFRSLLQRHPDPEVRQYIGNTFIWALESIAGGLPHIYDPPELCHGSSEGDDEGGHGHGLEQVDTERSVIEGTVFIFNHLWRYFQMHLRSWDEYFSTMLGFAKLGNREVAALLGEDFLLRVLHIISADLSSELPPNYTRMLHNVLRRMNSRPPSYVSILALIRQLIYDLEPELGSNTIVESPMDRLDEIDKPFFCWSSDEVRAVHRGLEDPNSSLFVEKLLVIDQARELTDSVIQRLIKTGPDMDLRVYNTLRRNIRADTSTQPMDPFLRVGAVFVESTAKLDLAKKLTTHICAQAKNLQNTEGSYLIDFFRTVLELERPDVNFTVEMRDFGLGLMPKWIPYLLAYPDAAIRRKAEVFLGDQLFQRSSLAAMDEHEGDSEQRRAANAAVNEVGAMCLAYLHEHHVKDTVQIGQETAEVMTRVIGRCAQVYELDHAGQEIDLPSTKNEILDPLRRLIVEDVEDDGSGMFQSLSDSDTVTADLS